MTDFLCAEKPALTFRFGEFTFHSGSRVLLLGDRERHLSPKAQILLRSLLEARPRALSREELYDALWPSTFVCETNLAGVVKQLREALGDEARAAQYIRTVHGFGYAFSGPVSVSTQVCESLPTPPVQFAVAATLSHDGVAHALSEGENLIGRAVDSRVVLTDRSVSRRHAMVTICEGVISIKDLGSTNGTYVEGKRIICSNVRSGTRIWFGNVEATINSHRISTTPSLRLNMQELQRKVAERMVSA